MDLNYAEAKRFVEESLRTTGMPDEAVEVVTGHLLSNEVLGRTSHGLFRLPGILRAASEPMGTDCSISTVADSCVLMEGEGLPGIYAMQRAASELARRLTESQSPIMIGVRGYRGTTGSIGLFTLDAARTGGAVLATCNSEAAIAAPGATNPIVGTNPLAFAFPSTDGRVVVGDFASSVWSYGDIAVSGLRGQELPPGVVLDDRGEPSVKPADGDDGSMLPSGGAKGFCQALMIELLCGAVVGSKIGAEMAGGDGALMLGLPDGLFDGEVSMRARVGAMIDQIESSSPTEATVPRVPGSRYRLLEGAPPAVLSVDDVVVNRLRAAGLGL